jgi:large subunit ribosomal protein L4
MKEKLKEKNSKIDIFSLDGRMVEKISIPNQMIDTEVNTDLLHQVIYWQLTNKRSGNHNTKIRSEINLSTKKIQKQKGSGRARHCTKSANIFRGGAKALGPKTRDHSISINKKQRLLALKMAITYAIKTNVLFVVDSFEYAEPKTKYWVKNCTFWNKNNGCLLIGNSEKSNNIIRSTKNIKNCNFLDQVGLNVYDIINNGTVLITKDSLLYAIERLNYE